VTRTTTVLQTRRDSSIPICDSYNYRPLDKTCSSTPICDSYNYRPSDKTCQFNTDLSLVQLPSFRQDVRAQNRYVTRTTTILQTRRASSTHTTLHATPTRPTSSTTATGPGGIRSSAVSSEQHRTPRTMPESAAPSCGSV